MPSTPLDRNVDSKSAGDPSRHLSLAALETALLALPPAPRDQGHVAQLMRRGPGGLREVLPAAPLTTDGGIPGESWSRGPEPNPDAQIAVLQRDVAELIANGQPTTLFGDCLILELDLSTANLPTGSRLRAGRAVLEVTPKAHTGCSKFRARFGEDAYRLVWKPEFRQRNLRGIYLRVVEDGEIKKGDLVKVISRGRP